MNESMTIAELREHKAAMEKIISNAVAMFEQNTGAMVHSVVISHGDITPIMVETLLRPLY